MKPPFETGTRVRHLGTLYSGYAQPVEGEVVGWNPASGHVSVLWDFYPPWPMLEYPREIEAIDPP